MREGAGAGPWGTWSRVGLEAGRRRPARIGKREHLEQGAHFRRVRQTPASGAEIGGLSRRGAGNQCLRPDPDAKGLEELALGYRTVDPRSGLGGGAFVGGLVIASLGLAMVGYVGAGIALIAMVCLMVYLARTQK